MRSAIQAGRALRPQRAVEVGARGLRPAWVFAFAGAVGLAFSVVLILFLWPGRATVPGAVGHGIGVGQGFGLMDAVLRWSEGVRTAWGTVSGYLDRLAPLGKAARAGLGGIAGALWGAFVLGALATGLFLWRLASHGQKRARRVDHA